MKSRGNKETVDREAVNVSVNIQQKIAADQDKHSVRSNNSVHSVQGIQNSS